MTERRFRPRRPITWATVFFSGSLRRRMAGAFLALALLESLVFGVLAWGAYHDLSVYLVRWHLEPVLELVAEVDRDGDEAAAAVLAQLADDMDIKIYRDGAGPTKYIPAPERGKPRLTRLESERYALSWRSKQGREYVLVGKIDDFDDLEEVLLQAFLLCAAGGLLAAVVFGLTLGRRISGPLLTLARRIRDGENPGDTPELLDRRDEVGLLTRAFAEREGELRAFLVREQLFTGDVSHEVRTPLTVLRGGLEILEAGRSMESGPDASILARMTRTVDSMSETVNTLLLLARRPEQLERGPLDMTALVCAQANAVEQAFARRGLAFEIDAAPGIVVRGHAGLAGLVVRNLLDNALRYAETGGVVLRLDAEGLIVEDGGPPITENLRERLFERGVRGGNGTPGSGLGLALVRRACEHLGWAVNYRPGPDGGNVFYVRFRCRF